MKECKLNEKANWFEMCDFLKEVAVGESAGFTQAVLTVRSEKTRRLAIHVGNKAKGIVELNYCPFCGENIETVQG